MLNLQRRRSATLFPFRVSVEFLPVREELGGGDEDDSEEFCEGRERVPLGLRSCLTNCGEKVGHLDGEEDDNHEEDLHPVDRSDGLRCVISCSKC